MNNIEIRDKREKNWFYMDNEYLNGYAKLLGGNCTLTYISLCRHSNETTQQCFPSMKKIAEENGISEKSVERATKTLQEWGIVHIYKSKKKDGTQANNIYTLLSKKNWREKPTDCESVRPADRQNDAQPTDKIAQNRPTVSLYNNTNINNTNINNTNTNTFGEFKRVKMSDEEYTKLVDLCGEKNTAVIIAEIDIYCASKGKSYKNYYATALNWIRRKGEAFLDKKEKQNLSNSKFNVTRV